LHQREGASTARQLEYAATYAARHGLPLDETLTDEGLSAFHQKHVTQGKLGRFLAAVKAGEVPRGSVLIVEQFDRLSRADALTAQTQLGELIHAGITVITSLDGREWSKKTLTENPYLLVEALVSMIRANDESVKKSGRIRDAMHRLCKGWQAGTYRGAIRVGASPAWLRWVGPTATGHWEFIPERVAAIKRAADLYTQGHSATMVLKVLHAEKLSPFPRPIGNAGHLVRLFQRNEWLIGDRVVTVANDDGTEERYELTGHYPPVFTRPQWNALQAIAASRTRAFVRSDVPAVLTGFGVTSCGYCGSPLRSQSKTGKRTPDGRIRDGDRRLLCSKNNTGDRCPVHGSCSAAPIEAAIVGFCTDERNLRALAGSDRAATARTMLEACEATLAAKRKAYDRLTEVILATEGNTKRLAAQQSALADEIETAEAAADAAARALATAMGPQVEPGKRSKQWRAVVDGVQMLDSAARITARQLLADTFASIAIYHSGAHQPRKRHEHPRANRVIDVVLTAKGSGVRKVLRLERDAGEWSVTIDEIQNVPEAPARRARSARAEVAA